MDRAIAARIQEWDAHPLTGGYRGLEELSGANFSGAVTTGTAWLFMLNGRVVGVIDGTMASFESSEATAYEAPDAALPLLFAMQERGGETQAKYYTDDTPLAEVHGTLSDAGFTGYIELSENVLSGDYYVVYYGGRSMSVAFVGNAARLLSGDEAFEQAADEVGIYEVVAVELDVRDVPSAGADDAGGADAAAAGAAAGAADADEPTAGADEEAADAVDGGETAPDVGGVEPAEPTAEPGPVDPTPDAAGADPEPGGSAADGATGLVDPSPDAAGAAGGSVGTSPPAEPDDVAATGDDPFTQEAAWRESRTIPALDPEETDRPATETAGNGGTQPEPAAEPSPPAGQTGPSPAEPATDADAAGGSDRLSELEAALQAQSATIEQLKGQLESSAAESEQLRQERERLEGQLASAHGADGATGRAMDPATALEQTDLFVRYGTKGGGTLEKAHDGVIDREEVVENLRVEHHTRFDADAVTVAGQPFQAFLESTVEHRFVDWLVTRLLFEIQATGSQRGLRDLFDALPLVDRVEFHGSIELRDEAGETSAHGFDVICRNRMGQPLVVANINDDRDPATGEMMAGLVEATAAVAEQHETLGGAFLVTSSFFRPDALETADEATGGGLLAREKRWSYVKTGRKRGFHLCLVEARGDNFHVAVPEL